MTSDLCPLPYRVMAVVYVVTVSTADLATLHLKYHQMLWKAFLQPTIRIDFYHIIAIRLTVPGHFAKIHLGQLSFVSTDSLPEHVVFGWQCLSSHSSIQSITLIPFVLAGHPFLV